MKAQQAGYIQLSNIAIVVGALFGLGFIAHYLFLFEVMSLLFAYSSSLLIASLVFYLIYKDKNSLWCGAYLLCVLFASLLFNSSLELQFIKSFQPLLAYVFVGMSLVLYAVLYRHTLVNEMSDIQGPKKYFAEPASWYLLLSAFVLLVSIAQFVLVTANNQSISGYLYFLGLAIHMVIVFYAVRYKHHQVTEQNAVKAQNALIAIQEQNKADLEYSIEERTLELEITLRELGEKNRELEKLSAIDPLTGLINRRYFDKRILAESRRSRREMTKLAIAILDIDHFKKINDTYGHLCGDHCLKVFAETLKDIVKRPSDTICRFGGEEFVLILPNTDGEGLRVLLEKMRQKIESRIIKFENSELQMTVSIGACTHVIAHVDEHESILAFVDKQLYKAKDQGRNRVVIGDFASEHA